ncbi:MAG: hypothetical protein LAO07_18835, partial [Acidobacteriia bacterium]|nr:hypothetical protein [Terriglobia bacterium]
AIFDALGGGKILSGRTTGFVEKFSVAGNGNLLSAGSLSGTQLVSTVPTGTPPLSVASTTLVPNLNASFLAGRPAGDIPSLSASNVFASNQYFSGYVGVGTTDHSAMLTVNSNLGGVGPAVPGIAIGNPAGTTAIWMGKGSNNYLEIAWIDPSFGRIYLPGNQPLALQQTGGNVGIGTTSPLTQLHIRKDGAGVLGPRITLMNASGGAGAGASIDFDGYNPNTDPPTARIRSLDDGNYSSHLTFATKVSGASANALTERMRIASDGKVAINTTDPVGARLRVNSNNPPDCVAIRAVMGSDPGYGCSVALSGHSATGTGVAGTGYYGVSGVAYASGGYGVYGAQSLGTYAGYFSGNVNVTGTLTKGGGSFKIDHPLDPADKYLSHSFVESPDMKNVYDGVVVLDAKGEAWVTLPEWFEALNSDFRYQLTCIGGFAPVFIAEEIAKNRFEIAGGREGLKVSWQVTGIRQDAYAKAHRIPVEEEKPVAERGLYLHPELFGQPKQKGIEWAHQPAGMPPAEGGHGAPEAASGGIR